MDVFTPHSEICTVYSRSEEVCVSFMGLDLQHPLFSNGQMIQEKVNKQTLSLCYTFDHINLTEHNNKATQPLSQFTHVFKDT